jgi:heme-degrading monooxygenase HmoA
MHDRVQPGAVIESVTFELVEGTREEVFVSAVARSNKFLESCPGFLGRKVSKSRDAKRWLDLVYWESMDRALAAAARFNASPDTAAFNGLLKTGTVAMAHFEVRATSDA